MPNEFMYISILNPGGGTGGVTNYYSTIISGGTTNVGGTTSNYYSTIYNSPVYTGGTTNITSYVGGTTNNYYSTVYTGGTTNITTGGTTNISNYYSGSSIYGGPALVAAGGTITDGSASFANSNGMSFGVSGSVITGSVNSTHTHGAVSLALSNLTGAYTSASGGMTLGLTGAASGGAGGAAISASGGSQNSGTVVFSNSNNVSFGFSGGSITASASGILSDLTVSNLTLSVGTGAASSNVTIIGPDVGTAYYANPPWQGGALAAISNLTQTNLTNRPLFFPFRADGVLLANEVHFEMSRVAAGSNSFTIAAGIYSQVNSSQIALIGSDTHFFVNTAVGATGTGVYRFEISMGSAYSTLPPGDHVLGMGFTHAGSTSAMNFVLLGDATTLKPIAMLNEGSNSAITHTSHQDLLFWGRYTATSNGLPATVGLADVIGGISGASVPMPFYFTLGNHV